MPALPNNSVPSISANPPENKGLDYAYLRAEGVRLLQAYSGRIWTDYNEHDPGVTTLEILCYALTELSYRAELPIKDLLAQESTGKVEARRHGMFPARSIMPCNPVTVDDYRKLFIDRIEAVANAWVTPYKPTGKPDTETVRGLYDVVVYVPNLESEEDLCGEEREAARTRRKRLLNHVHRVYHRHRNLCEDVRSIEILEPLHTEVHSNVDVFGDLSDEKILAQILFRIGSFIAPEIQKRPLNELIAAGQTPSEIFLGPLLRNGFIDDGQLTDRATEIGVSEILSVMAQTPGVLGVRWVEVTVGGEHYKGNQTVPAPSDRFLKLSTVEGKGHGFPIRLFRNGLLVQPNPQIVRAELTLLWAAYRRDYPLAAQYEEYLGIPTGTWRDLGRYYSIQNEYPAVYGIGADGLPPEPSQERMAMAKQFKGYLLPFEQLMANYLAQMANVGNLFATNTHSSETNYGQSLQKSVPGIEPLLAANYLEGLEKLVESDDDRVNRRNGFLSFLLSLYANDLTQVLSTQGSKAAQMTRLLQYRQKWIKILARSTRSRGTGYNVRGPISRANVAGMEAKCRIELGLDLEHHAFVRDSFDQTGSVLQETSFGKKTTQGAANRIHERFRPLQAWPQPAGVPESSRLLSGETFSEPFIRSAMDHRNLFLGNLYEDELIVIAIRDEQGDWLILGEFEGFDEAVSEAYALCWHLMRLHNSFTQLHIVEQLFLRAGTTETDIDDSFQITAVVALPSERLQSQEYREVVSKIVIENTPAHILASFCFLGPFELFEFEWLYLDWRQALRRGLPHPIAETSTALRDFLDRHRSENQAALGA